MSNDNLIGFDPLVAAGSTLTADAGTHRGRTILLDTAAGSVVTLPAATGSGARFRFVVSVVPTSNSHKVQVTGDDTMDGHIFSCNDTDASVSGWETAAASDTVTLNGTTTGGAAIGDWVEVQDIASDQWVVTGFITSTGTEATPFSAAVS